jgi:hypothetical protein
MPRLALHRLASNAGLQWEREQVSIGGAPGSFFLEKIITNP